MGRVSGDPKAMLPEITRECRELFGDALISLILYGSAAGQDYTPGQSDINLMIVLRETAMERLDSAFGMVAKWRRKGFAMPVFLTERYIAESLDVFPVEYLNFKHRYVMAYGKDVLRGIELQRRFLRLQCEREIKGKLFLLRQGFVESGGKRRVLETLVCDSTGALAAIFRSLSFLQSGEIPGDKRTLFDDVSRRFGLDSRLFHALLDVREKRSKPSKSEMQQLVKRYLKEMEILSNHVDRMEE